MDRPKALVLGPSHWHLPLYADRITARFDVIGVSDANTDAATPFAAGWRAPLFSDWRELLSRHPVADVAFVLTPHDEMRDAALALIDRGIPLVLEKPGGISAAQVAEVRRAATEAGVPVTVPLVQRNGPVDVWLARAGDALYESTQFIAGPPERYLANGSPWMVESARAGGGCMINLAPHFVDLFLQSSGASTASVHAAVSSALHGREIEDFATLTLRTADGRVATIESGYAFPSSALKRFCAYRRIGTRGTATIAADGRASFTDNDGRTVEEVLDVDSDPLYPVFADAVADGLADGFAGMPGLTDLERAMSLIWDAYDYASRREAGVLTQH